jgi:hypothetical protein
MYSTRVTARVGISGRSRADMLPMGGLIFVSQCPHGSGAGIFAWDMPNKNIHMQTGKIHLGI